MNAVLEDEITSINAIYEEDTLVPIGNDNELVLRPPQSHISLRLRFPETYPESPPRIIGPHSIGEDTRKGEAQQLADLATSVLGVTFIPGEPSVYDLLEELMTRLENQRAVLAAAEELSQASIHDAADISNDAVNETQQLLKLEPPWSLSDPIIEKRSIFLARAARVDSPTLANSFVRHLVFTDKKAAKATHNITAWRIRDKSGSGVTYQDCNDDGETAAGGRLLHLMQIMDVWTSLSWYRDGMVVCN